ncbi:MAG TPA: hypothetical protein VI456_11735 [Polyangia bacterium]
MTQPAAGVTSRSLVAGFSFHSLKNCQAAEVSTVATAEPTTPKPLPRAIR